MFVNLIVADRLAPRHRARPGPKTRSSSATAARRAVRGPHPLRGRGVLRDRHGRAASRPSGSDWILFSNSTTFGIKDPQFHQDIGFYVFRLPFLQFIAGWTFAALLVVLIVTAVFHYLNGGIRLQTPVPAGHAAGEGAHLGDPRR